MKARNKNNKRSFLTISPKITIIICFILGIADMILLQESVNKLFFKGNQPGEAGGLALMLATIANFTAFMWGKENGEKLQRKLVNRHSFLSFVIWLLIGCVVYAGMRILGIDPNKPIATEVIQVIILGILYIGTGLIISRNATIIFKGKQKNAK